MDYIKEKLAGFFDLKLVNGQFGDPCLYVFSRIDGHSYLFDIGNIDKLTNKEILKIKKVFISHTHIDHFIGFDRLIRVQLPYGINLEIVGPKQITLNVYSKLNAYTWNLLKKDQIMIKVIEVIDDRNVKISKLNSSNNFEITEVSQNVIEDNYKKNIIINLISFSKYFMLDIALLDHRTPVLSYMIKSVPILRLKKDQIKKYNLKTGPWISKLQKDIIKNENINCININGFDIKIKNIFNIIKLNILVYITDIVFSENNINVLDLFIKNCKYMLCESTFLDVDKDLAYKKKHLTTSQAAQIAYRNNVEESYIFHFSNRYNIESNIFEKEFNKFLNQYLNNSKNS